MFRKKQTCTDCHFFNKIYHVSERHVFIVTEEERQQTKAGDFSWVKDYNSMECSYGVWTEGYQFDRKNRLKCIVKTDRRDYCFFFEYKVGMLIPAAKILQERDAEVKKLLKDRRIAKVGLWVASIALIVNAYLKVAESQNWIPY